jgi:hypothetical protein
MNDYLKFSIDLIEKHGGIQTSQMLSRIFNDSNQEFGNNFDSKVFFDELYKLHNPIGENQNQNVNLKPRWNSSGKGNWGNNSFNFIPTINPNGGCSTFCLALISLGFDGKGSGNRHNNQKRIQELSFDEAILSLCQYWFSCLKINEENLLITSNWNQDKFVSKFQNLIESYTLNHDKKVFIVELTQLGPILRYPYA